MQPARKDRSPRSRLAPEERRAQLIELAASAALARGNLPIALNELAGAAGVSKALVYAYFPSQHDLFNAVLASDFDELARAGLLEAAAADLDHAAAACAAIYFDHLVAKGPVAHLVLRDAFMRGHVIAQNRAFRDRIARRFARAAARELQLNANEAVAAFNLAVTIPEEAALLVRSGDTPAHVARELVAQLVQSTLGALSGGMNAGDAQGVGGGR